MPHRLQAVAAEGDFSSLPLASICSEGGVLGISGDFGMGTASSCVWSERLSRISGGRSKTVRQLELHP